MISLAVRRGIGVVAALTFLGLGAPAHAQGTSERRTQQVDVTWSDGGRAIGFVVFEHSVSIQGLRYVRALEWTVMVRGGDETIFPPVVYTDSTSTASTAFDTVLFFTLNGQAASVRRLLHYDPGNGTVVERVDRSGQASTRWVDTEPVEAAIPVVVLTVNGERPASRLVVTDPDFVLTVQIGSGTTPLDWYWGVAVNDRLYWVTPTGVSLTPAPILQGPTPYVPFLTVPFQADPGTTITNFFVAVGGGTVVAGDAIAAVAGGALTPARK